MKGNKKQKATLPATVAGATGEEAFIEEFRKEYSALYNSHHDEEAMKKMTEELKAKVTDESVGMVKPGKGDVTGSYTSDASRSCPPIFFEKMAAMFQSWLYHGMVTPSLLYCAYLSLYKGGLKDLASCSSYR